MKKIFLHIGMHKTGTSSIQRTLFQAHDLLKNFNVFYPTSLGENHSIPLFSNFCENPSRYYLHVKNGLSQKEIEQFNKNYISSFLDELKHNQNTDTLVLSGEDVSSLTETDLIRLRSFINKELVDYELNIVYFIRNPWDYITSSTQEYLKVGHNKPSIPNSIYEACLAKFITVFGKETISVYSFEVACENEYGPVGEFLKIIGIPIIELKQFPIFRVNESLSYQAVEIIEYVNRTIPFYNNSEIAIGRMNGDLSPLYPIRGDRYTLSKDEYLQLTKNIQLDLEWLYTNFNVAYSCNNHVDNDIVFEYGEQYFSDFVIAYPELSKTLKILVYHFIQNKLAEVKTIRNKSTLKRIVDYLKAEFSYITRYDYNLFMNEMVYFQNFKTTLEITKQDAEIYRDLAVYLEANKQYDAAYFYMKRALELRPDGPFIKKRLELLKEKLVEKNDKLDEIRKSSTWQYGVMVEMVVKKYPLLSKFIIKILKKQMVK